MHEGLDVGEYFGVTEPLEFIVHAQTLAQGFVAMEVELTNEVVLAAEHKHCVVLRVHVEIEEHAQLVENGRGEKLGLVENEHRDEFFRLRFWMCS